MVGTAGVRGDALRDEAQYLKMWGLNAVNCTLGAEKDATQEGDTARRSDTLANPSRRGTVGTQKAGERRATLPAVEIDRPAWDRSDHRLHAHWLRR